MKALYLVALLGLGCARAATVGGTGGSGGDATGGSGPEAAPPDARPPGADATGAPSDGPGPDGTGFIPPSRRDGGIPRPPSGDPPCAPDSKASDGNACPYQSVVGCTPARDAGPAQVCYCFAPPLDGKWHCEAARDAGR